MPLKSVRYRVKQTPKGPVRLAFRKSSNEVVEAKNLRTSATHTPSEFARDRARRARGLKGKR